MLYFLNVSLFPHQNILSILKYSFFGLRFDISALLYANLPVIFLMLIPFRFRHKRGYQSFTGLIFVLVNAILLIPNLADSIYYRFTMKRLTADIFKYLTVGADTGIFAQFLKDFWYIFLTWFFLIGLLVWYKNKIRVQPDSTVHGNVWYYSGQTLLCFVFSGIFLLGMRGGFQLKPINLINATQYAEAQDVPLVLNSAFTIMKTINQQGLEKKNYFKNEKESAKTFSALHDYTRFDSLGQPLQMNRMNIVLIILESISMEHIGSMNRDYKNYMGFTPFLDSLIRQYGCFEGAANGKRSIEGIPAILGSLPTWMDRDFITSQYSANRITSLASLLKGEGYVSSFFHGGNNGTMGFNNYTRAAGFDNYYGRTEYGNENDYDGKWGIWDEPFLQYYAGELNRMQQPFISSVFTLSSHHPYKVPEKYKGKFRKGELPIQQTIMYTDHALAEFFRTISSMDWFSNTMFVITADHTSEAYFAEYKTRIGQYRIPIVMFIPGKRILQEQNQLMQQTDIMPSILDYLRYPKPFVAFGTSVFRKNEPRFGLSLSSGSYQLLQDDYALTCEGDAVTSLYNYNKDSLLLRNLHNQEPDRVRNLLNLYKAVIQEYNNRMIENRLTVK
jgi:phosphoglycerol transferase MdoB-like AlkP superfamily enzyme